MKILLLAGGDSSEREVSMSSGKAVCETLNRLGHTVRAIDAANGKSLLGTDGKFIEADRPPPDGNQPATIESGFLARSLAGDEFGDIEIVFNALHGGAGENGTIQGLLDLARMKYTGSGMAAAAIAMNKHLAKKLFASVGIPAAAGEMYEGSRDPGRSREIASDITRRFDFPLIIKPNDSGSTVGLSKVTAEEQLLPAIELAFSESQQILAEAYLAGRELTVSVLAEHAFPVVEIVPKSGLYDYQAKYTPGMSTYIAPARISDRLSDGLQEAAQSAYRVVGARGLARIDFIADNSDRFHILELNTLPGLTELSLAPMAARCEGIDFDNLIQMIIDDAAKEAL